MRDILLLAAMVTLIPGLVLRLMLRRHLTAFGRSRRWYNLAYWFTPPWKASTVLTPRGVSLFWTSTTLILLGVILYLVSMRLT